MLLNNEDYDSAPIEEQAEALAKQKRRYSQIWLKVPKPNYNSAYNDFDLIREGIELPEQGDAIRGYRFYQEGASGELHGGYGYAQQTSDEATAVEPVGYYYHNQEVSTSALGAKAWQWLWYQPRQMHDVEALTQYPIVGYFKEVPPDDGFVATDISRAGEATSRVSRKDINYLRTYIKEHYNEEGIKIK